MSAQLGLEELQHALPGQVLALPFAGRYASGAHALYCILARILHNHSLLKHEKFLPYKLRPGVKALKACL